MSLPLALSEVVMAVQMICARGRGREGRGGERVHTPRPL
jgi:hypothetical protein